MSCTILRRRWSLHLKAFIPLVLLSFLLTCGIPFMVHSAEVIADSSQAAADTTQVAPDTSLAVPDTSKAVRNLTPVAPDTSKKASDTLPAATEPVTAAPDEFVDEPSSENLRRGERFFKGFLPVNRQSESCVSCHNINTSDTLNWNPSALEIAEKYKDKDFAAFSAVVMQPGGVKMAEVHKNFEIDENDLKRVKLYLDNFATTGPPEMGPTITQLLLFGGLITLLILALLDLMFFHKIKYRMVPILVLLLAFGYITMMIYDSATDLGRTQNYEPDQPVKFSHQVHAGQNKIDCQYCHYTAERSGSAGIPPVDLCMNCHTLVREGTRSGRFEIAKVVESFEQQKPIEWIRVHNLPDHVFFSHAQHVKAGQLDCKECHGAVEEMHVVSQVEDLSMGWCLNCHRTKAVQFADNKFYESYERLHEEIKSGKIDSVTVEMIGGTDCMKCHY